MLIIIFFNLFVRADFKLEIEASKYVDTNVYLNNYSVKHNNFMNFIKSGKNSLRVCFKNKKSKPLKIKNHVRVELTDSRKNITDIVVDGALTSVKSAPVLSFYSLKSNNNNGWVCESKFFTNNGTNNLYFYLANKHLKHKKSFNKKLTPILSKTSNAIDKHQVNIKKVYKIIRDQKPNLNSQANRNIRALIGQPKENVSILGNWRDKNTGIVYSIKPGLIEVSNMPNGFYMNYKKVGRQKLRVKVLNNSFDLLYKLKSKNEMIQKNTQSGLIRELIRL